MKIEHKTLGEIKLMGIMARTNNASECNPASARITPTVQKYFGQGYPELLPHRAQPSVTYCAYTDYESDMTGDYTFFVGEQVTCFDDMPSWASHLIIPPQNYAVFTTEPGPMPDVCIQAWQHIWGLKDAEFGGKRAYTTDFEIYDERAVDLTNTVLDVYIGIKA